MQAGDLFFEARHARCQVIALTGEGRDDTRQPLSRGSGPATSSGWRYQYSSVGDLLAVRDSRGCGANYYYDMAGRTGVDPSVRATFEEIRSTT